MDWLSKKWPALIGLFGLVLVTALIWREISVRDTGGPSADGDAYGLAFALLTLGWWGYFFLVAIASWLVAFLLRVRAIWLLFAAPIIAMLFVSETAQIASYDRDIIEIATNSFVATVVAALPILVGASSHIAERILSLRNGGRAVTGPTIFDKKE